VGKRCEAAEVAEVATTISLGTSRYIKGVRWRSIKSGKLAEARAGSESRYINVVAALASNPIP